METIVKPIQFAAMGASLVIAVGLPVLLAILWHKRTGAKWISLLVGMLIFPAFVFGLENVCHQLFIYQPNPISNYVNAHPLILMLYGGLAAGIFEETGRLVAFFWLLRKQNGREAGVMYGIGHGGIEAALICGVGMVSNIAFSIALNTQGAAAMLASVPAEQQATIAASIESLNTAPAGMLLMSGVERIIAITLHIALSVLVFTAVKRKKMWLYPVAILLHAAVDCIAVLYQQQYITNIYVLEAIIAAATAAIAYWAYRIYQADAPVAMPEEAPVVPENSETVGE